MLHTELQELLEQARQLAPVIGLCLLALPGVVLAVHVLGIWDLDK